LGTRTLLIALKKHTIANMDWFCFFQMFEVFTIFWFQESLVHVNGCNVHVLNKTNL
jgi:hypothetical protein